MSTMVYRSAGDVVNAMNRVYMHMLLAVVNSFLVSFTVSSSAAAVTALFTGWTAWVVILAPLAVVIAMTLLIDRLNRSQLLTMLHVFAGLMGLSMSLLFAVYTLGSVAAAFMGAAVLFATLTLYGYFTKRDLTSLGQLMFVGLIAVIIASVINLFIGNTVAATVISAVSVLVFLGLTAYDTQRIREMVSVGGDTSREEIMGALALYMDFINLFINLLQLIGSRKD